MPFRSIDCLQERNIGYKFNFKDPFSFIVIDFSISYTPISWKNGLGENNPYELDKDELSYIWQNLAPRDYQKLEVQKDVVAHELFNTELLTEQNIMIFSIF